MQIHMIYLHCGVGLTGDAAVALTDILSTWNSLNMWNAL